MRTKKTWVYTPPKPVKPKITETFKQQVQTEADRLVEALKAKHIKPPPKNSELNYVTDIFTTWYRSYFYFCATYACPSPYAISPTFELRFARLEYAGGDRFHLAYMRHTGQWWQIYTDITLKDALEAIREQPHFAP